MLNYIYAFVLIVWLLYFTITYRGFNKFFNQRLIYQNDRVLAYMYNPIKHKILVKMCLEKISDDRYAVYDHMNNFFTTYNGDIENTENLKNAVNDIVKEWKKLHLFDHNKQKLINVQVVLRVTQ